MNLKNYLLGLFRGAHLNGELTQVEEAGRQTGRLLATTYMDAVEDEAFKVLSERQNRFIGLPAPEIEGEFEIEPEPEAIEPPKPKATRKRPAKAK